MSRQHALNSRVSGHPMRQDQAGFPDTHQIRKDRDTHQIRKDRDRHSSVPEMMPVQILPAGAVTGGLWANGGFGCRKMAI